MRAMASKLVGVVSVGVVLSALVSVALADPSPTSALASQPAASSQPARSVTLDLGGGVKLDLVLIPAGKFMMGSPDSEKDRYPYEGPVHEVTIRQPFYMGKTEVTQAQWKAAMGNNPSRFKGDGNLPVESVSWENCQAFCRTLSQRTGRTVRLPSEAEWEYACRGGTTTRFSFGDDPDYSLLPQYAWFGDNSGKSPINSLAVWQQAKGDLPKYAEAILANGCQTHVVGQMKPNAWGLYDMHGNVTEWCQDARHDNYTGAPADGSAWTAGGDQDRRVLRSGCWGNVGKFCRSANRYWYGVGNRGDNVGFRVVVASGTP